MLRYLLVLLVLCAMCHTLQATHNRSGEITYVQDGPLTVTATITTYTKASSTGADRDSLELFWGDGTSTVVPRSNQPGEVIPGFDLKVNYYIASHTYPSVATYTMYFIDPNRVGGILNLNFPNSVDIRFYIETTFTLLSDQFQGLNNSAILLNPPIDFACTGERFIHNPNAFDADGDSLAYELVVPLEDVNTPVPNYELPDNISPGLENNISFNKETGDFIWDAPVVSGEYSIAILIKEYRDRVLINEIVRDMQIFVDICDNSPPVIEAVEEICVVAGDVVEIPIIVNDEDGDQVRVTATGGLFQNPNANILWDNSGTLQDVEFSETLIWNTTCSDITEQPYQLVIRATDNGLNGNQGLTDLKTILIKVVGPPPLDLQIDRNDGAFDLTWELPYQCENASDNYFRGFSVWRKEGSNPFEVDTCMNGLEGRGYEILEFLTEEESGGRYFYKDDTVEPNKVYCYRILANFALETSGGFIFNVVESLPSEEKCETSSRDVPLLTKVDVLFTDNSQGEINIEWIKPEPEDLDTLENPGPYTYQLERSIDGIQFVDIPDAVYTTALFSDTLISSYIDQGLNTMEESYFYQMRLESTRVLGTSPMAESVFINIVSSDRNNTISWNENTPWLNYEYNVFQYNPFTSETTFLDKVPRQSYQHQNLLNGIEYCYIVESVGSYGLDNTPDIILNNSQVACGTPIDSIATCAPTIEVSNGCNDLGRIDNVEELENEIRWESPLNICENAEDLVAFNIYYAQNLDADYEIIREELESEILSYIHIPEEGNNACYFVTTLDISGNESNPSNIICVDNCPTFELPNTFTPNGDGANDVLIPRRNKFISTIQFEIFNMWGNKVYETQDPMINWNGIDFNGNEVENGTYYYSCIIFDESVEGLLQERAILDGYIEVLR